MSTYTDLHNKVKESLNVDYHSRETNQKSLFLNPENEYWGTFHGEVDVRGASINNGVLSDVTIYKANLICSSLDGVDVTTFGKRLHTLDDYVHGAFTEKIDMEDARLQNEIDKEVTARKNAVKLLSSNLSIALNSEISARIHGDEDSISYTTLTADQLRKEIQDEMSARQAEDNVLHAEDCRLSNVDYDLSCQIIDTNLRLDAESNTRYAEDTRLDIRIDELDNQSNARYLSAMSALAEHAELNEQQLRDLSVTIDDKVEHDKHYEIIDTEKIQSTYPYVLKDYAINRLEISAVDGYAYHTYNDRDINVGMLVCENADYNIPLTMFGLQHRDPVVYNALNPNFDLKFEEYGIPQAQRPAAGREYTIKIVNGDDFEHKKFILQRDGDTYLPVIFDGRLIGKIHDYDTTPAPSGRSIVKRGLLTITSLDTDLQPFKHIVWRFNSDIEDVEYVEDEVCIKYNCDNTFSLGYNPLKCQQIIDPDEGDVFAKVYDGGILYDEDWIAPRPTNDELFGAYQPRPSIKNVRTKVGTLYLFDRTTDERIETPINKYFDLSVSNDFSAEIAPFVYLKCDFNDGGEDYIDEYTSYKFKVEEITHHLKYGLKLSSDEELVGETVAYVTVGAANVKIQENTFTTLSVDFSEHIVPGLLPASFEKVYLLKKDRTTPEHLWKAVDENSDGDKIQITYDGAAINVKMMKRVSEGVTYIKFLIDTENPAIGVDRSRIVCQSDMMPINTREFTEWTYLGNTVAVVKEERTEEADQIVLNIKKNVEDEAVFVIPDRLATKKDYSREMLLVVKFMSSDPSRMINVKFVDPSGQPVKYFYDKHPQLLVGVNKYVTIKITEVANKKFLITDWNETEIRAKIIALKQYIEDTADALSTDYIARDLQLSAVLSTEIEERIAGDLFLSNELSTFEEKTEEEIQYLSNEVSTFIRRDAKGMKYFGDVRLSDAYNVDEIGAVTKEDWSLYGLLKTNDFINVSGKELRTGFLFRATGDATRTFTAKSPDHAAPLELHNNDYLVLNKDISALSCISTNDIDIWKDYDLSVATLISNINEVSAWLSSTLSVEIENRISSDEFLSNDYNEKISVEAERRDADDQFLSSEINVLQEDVEVIQDTIRGGINYKGVVNVIDTDENDLGSFSLLCGNFHISNLFYIDFGTAGADVHPEDYYHKPVNTYAPSTILSNGFMYLIGMTDKNLSDQWYVDGIQLDDRDYVIINCRPNECKPISALTSADIDVIDALDSNVVTTQLADRLSTALSIDYVAKIADAKSQAYNEALSDANDYTDTVSSLLSDDYCAKDASVLLSAKNYADELSTSLSTDYIERITAEREHTDLVSALISAELSTFEDQTVSDINFISNEVSVAIRRDAKGMKYFGIVQLSDAYNVDEIAAATKEDWSLYGLLKTNAFINVSNKELKTGFTFRAAGDATRTFITKSPDGGSIELRSNDYLVLNKDIAALSDISTNDIDIWKDYDLSVATILSGINDISTFLSNSISNEMENRISSDEFLSTDYNEKIDAEAAQRDADDKFLSNKLSTFEDKTTTDINFISNEVSVELRRDRKGMKYFGDVRLSDIYNVDEIGAVTKEDWSLYGLLKTNDFINVSGKELRAGFTFRAVGDDTRTFTTKSPDGGSIELRNNDYIVLNKEISALSSVKVADIDIWKDYDLSVNTLCAFTLNEVKNLSVALSNDIDDLSARISGDINKLSDDLSGEIKSLSSRLSGDIDKLSDDLSGEVVALSTHLSNDVDDLSARLSGDIDSLSTRLSGDIDKLSDDLSGEIDSLSTNLSNDIVDLSTRISGDIDDLSADLSGEVDALSIKLSNDVNAFITNHYERTFDTDVLVSAAIDYKFDMLKMVDEEDPSKKFTMHLSGGTIVLIPMS